MPGVINLMEHMNGEAMDVKNIARFVLVITVLTLISHRINAFTLEIIAPRINEKNPAAETVNNEFSDEIDNMEEEIDDFLGDYSDLPELGVGFANSGVYTSHAASQRFTVSNNLMITAGSVVSIHAPSTDMSYYSELEDMLDDEDFQAGFGIAPAAIQAGINTDFIFPGLYLSVQYGRLDLSREMYGVNTSLNSRNYGIRGSYTIIDKKHGLPFILSWNGLTLSAGLVYSSCSMSLSREMDMFDENGEITYLTYSGSISMDPRFTINLKTSSYVLPVELMSSASFLGMNIAAGFGLDIFQSNAEVDLLAESDIDVEGTISPYVTPGSFYLRYNSKSGNVTGVISKIMFDFGLAIGPVLVDIPVTWHYPTGASVGITTGIRI
jgi:hypothetical protein